MLFSLVFEASMNAIYAFYEDSFCLARTSLATQSTYCSDIRDFRKRSPTDSINNRTKIISNPQCPVKGVDSLIRNLRWHSSKFFWTLQKSSFSRFTPTWKQFDINLWILHQRNKILVDCKRHLFLGKKVSPSVCA